MLTSAGKRAAKLSDVNGFTVGGCTFPVSRQSKLGKRWQERTQDWRSDFQVPLGVVISVQASGPTSQPPGEEEGHVSMQGPLTVPILGLGSQRWRRNEIMLFLISSAKKIFHLLPVRDARFSNKMMAVSLTSSCSCGNRYMSCMSPLFRSFLASNPQTHPARPHFSKGRLNPDTGMLRLQPSHDLRKLFLSHQHSNTRYTSLSNYGFRV